MSKLTARKPFGQSRISKDMIDIQNKARNTITRLEVLGEFNSFPQKYLLGLAEDNDFDKVRATYTSFLAISRDDEGNHPVVGQFPQAQTEPLINQLYTYARLFAGCTGLTTDDLGFYSENPSSNETIKAAHGDLVRIASKAQGKFGSCFLNVGLAAASLRDKTMYNREAIKESEVIWTPLFDIDNSAISSFGDGVIKINQSVPDAITPKVIKRMTGLPIEVE